MVRPASSATAGTIVGSYTVTASVAGVTTPASFALTNTASPQKLVAHPLAAVAGRAFINVVVATFTDSDPNASPSNFVAAIAWGDGITTSSTTVIADGQGRFHVLGTHTYVDAGTYTFSVQVTDNGGASATATSTARVTAHANIEAPSPVPAPPSDGVEQFDDLTSLREAVAYADSHPGPGTITFDPAPSGKAPRTIKLIGGPLVLTNPATTTIIGPGARRLLIQGEGKGPVFDIEGGSLALDGMTLSGGRADRGGGIRNQGGRLVLNDVVIRGNRARLGGGLYNDGTAVLNDVVIRGNRARIGSGLFSTRRPTPPPGAGPRSQGRRMNSHFPCVSGELGMSRIEVKSQHRAPADGGRQADPAAAAALADGAGGPCAALDVDRQQHQRQRPRLAARSDRPGEFRRRGRYDRLLQLVQHAADDHPDRRPARTERYKAPATITGPGANLLSVSGNNASRVFEIDGGVTASISGLKITGGSSGNDSGGGLQNKGTLNLTDCTVSGNTAGSGGGGLANYGTVTLTDCTVSGNSTSRPFVFGGGLWNTGTATLTDCTVSGNTAENGGGGGLENLNDAAPAAAELALINWTVSDNSAQAGGGVDNLEGTVTLTNCTVSGTSGSTNGIGGLNNNNGTAALTNTIVAGNSNGDLSGSYSGSNNLIGVDPLLAPLGDYGGPTQTMPLLPGSPAIGNGTSSGAPTTDQRGFARGSTVDIGAFQTNPLVVNTTIDALGSPSGDLSLRQAVNLANALGGGEAITFDATVFATPRMIALDGTQLELKSGTATITGPGASLLNISGNQASRVFQVDADVTASISGLTITGGNGGNFGGGLVNQGTLNLTDCTVSGNAASGRGGGLDNQGTLNLTDCTLSGNAVSSGSAVIGGGLFSSGTATLTDCTVSGNSVNRTSVNGTSAQIGGGLYNSGTITLTHCTVSDNSAGNNYYSFGGGLYNSGMAAMTDCMVSGNSADPGESALSEAGGGLLNTTNGTLNLTDCTVSGNSSVFGGGLENAGTASLINCTVSGNTAGAGGGLYNSFRTVTLTNCTVSGNYAYLNGGGLYNRDDGTAILTNTIVAGNSNRDRDGAEDVGGAISGPNNLIGGNPLLAALGDYGGPTLTYALLPGSPAIGAGTIMGATATDRRGGEPPRPATSTSAPSRARASPSPPSPAAPRRRPRSAWRSPARWR